MKNEVKIALISDLHYTLEPNPACPMRRGELALELLDSVIEQLNCDIRPDLVLCGGDLINFPDAPEAGELTGRLAEKFAALTMPYAVIRGNHDLKQPEFVKYFPFPETTDCNFVRIIAFDDEETPGYNARRSNEDLARMKQSAKDWDGIWFSFQHTPLTEAGRCLYGYEEADRLLEELTGSGCSGTLSGHYHLGHPLYRYGNLQILIQGALCEAPFTGSLLTVTEQGITSAATFQAEV